jgi:hypothetical protein
MASSLLNPAPVSGSVFNQHARLGNDRDFMKLEDLANEQYMNHMLSEGPQMVAKAANELAVSENQIVRGMGGFMGDIDANSMLVVDNTQGRIGDKKKPQAGVFQPPLLKLGKFNADVANDLSAMPYTRTSRAGGQDITEALPQEIGVLPTSTGLNNLGPAIDFYGMQIGESTRGSYN